MTVRVPLPDGDDDGELDLELEPPAPSSPPRDQPPRHPAFSKPVVCPQCGTPSERAVDPDDPLHTCPRCGVVYSEGDSIEEEPSAPALAEEDLGADLTSRRKDGEAFAGRTFMPRDRPEVPQHPFLVGTFTFPWQRGVALRWLVLVILFATGSFLGESAAALGNQAGIDTWTAALFATLFAVLLMMAASFLTMLYGLTILQDTAVGCHGVEDWPDANLFDGVAESFFVTNALGLAGLTGAVVFQGTGFLDDWRWQLVLTVSATVLVFPIILLSMLEAASPLMPISVEVWSSVMDEPASWFAFYSTSTLVLLVMLAAMAGGLFLPDHEIVWRIWTVAVIPLAAITFFFIYFRLLGRLAWCCSPQSHAEEDEEIPDASSQLST